MAMERFRNKHVCALQAQSSLLIGSEMSSSSSDSESCNWPRGGKRCCGTLNTPGASHGGRRDETDHCFPGRWSLSCNCTPHGSSGFCFVRAGFAPFLTRHATSCASKHVEERLDLCDPAETWMSMKPDRCDNLGLSPTFTCALFVISILHHQLFC